MDYRASTEIDLLKAVRLRLHTVLNQWCTESTCFVARRPEPPVVPTTNPVVTIVLDDTGFDPAMYSGGGPMQATGTVNIIVTVLTKTMLDSPPKSDVEILSEERGLINYRNQIITALTVSDPSCPDFRSPWVPTLEDGETTFLRDYCLFPTHSTGPREVQVGSGTMLGISITFQATQDLSLRPLETLQQL